MCSSHRAVDRNVTGLKCLSLAKRKAEGTVLKPTRWREAACVLVTQSSHPKRDRFEVPVASQKKSRAFCSHAEALEKRLCSKKDNE